MQVKLSQRQLDQKLRFDEEVLRVSVTIFLAQKKSDFYSKNGDLMWINRDFMVMGFSGDSMAGLLLAPHCLPHSFVFSFSVCSFAIFASIPIFRHNAKPAASLLFNRRHQSANAHNVQQTDDPLLLRSLFGHLLETHQQSVADVVLPIYGAHSGLLPGCFLPLRWRWEKMGKVPGRVEIHPENLLDFPANFMG